MILGILVIKLVYKLTIPNKFATKIIMAHLYTSFRTKIRESDLLTSSPRVVGEGGGVAGKIVATMLLHS